MAVFSQTAGAATSISVPSSPSNICEPEPPIFVTSTFTAKTTPAPPEAPAPEADSDELQTDEVSGDVTPDAANDNTPVETSADEPVAVPSEPANDNSTVSAAEAI